MNTNTAPAANTVKNPQDYPDQWICQCGNECDSDGFYPCLSDGTETEPGEGWDGLVVCARCGAVIDQTGKFVGQSAREKTCHAKTPR